MKITIKIIGDTGARVRANKVNTDFWFKNQAQLRHFVMKASASMRAKGNIVEVSRVYKGIA